MFQTIKNACKIPALRNKLLFTLLIVILYRLGANIPVPYVSEGVMGSIGTFGSGTILYYLNILSGGALGNATLFALGVSPYITASIVIQLLCVAIPYFENLAKDGEEGKKVLNKWTRGATAVLGLITAIGYTFLLDNQGMLAEDLYWFNAIVMIAVYCAGACLVMWLAERINEYGIGNGISIILFANIIARAPSYLYSLWMFVFTGGGFSGFNAWGIPVAIIAAAVVVGMVLLIVWITDSERRIPIVYAKQTRGRKQYGGQSSNLPIKLNMTGVMPIIFANSIVSIPATIASFFPNSKFWAGVNEVFSYNSWLYAVIFFFLIIGFAYFYVMISFNPVEVANNIQQNGGQIPGQRQGRKTAEYITRILNRITLLGALFVCVIAVFPLIVNIIAGYFGHDLSQFAFLGSSMVIVVGVALETVRDMEAQMALRNYKGFLD